MIGQKFQALASFRIDVSDAPQPVGVIALEPLDRQFEILVALAQRKPTQSPQNGFTGDSFVGVLGQLRNRTNEIRISSLQRTIVVVERPACRILTC